MPMVLAQARAPEVSPAPVFSNAMEPSHSLEVQETLWDGECCRFRVKPEN
ncbi:MAG: hypothetical protein ACLFPE_10845 [Bacteroidales bacterium]